MALADVLNLTQKRKKIGVSEERIKAVLHIVRKFALQPIAFILLILSQNTVLLYP